MLTNNSRNNRFNKDALLLCILPTLAVLAAMLVVSIWVWVTARQDVHRDQNTLVTRHVSTLQDLITSHLASYEEVLRGTAALLETSHPVSRDDFHAIISTYDIQTRFPGVRAIGYAPLLTNDNVQQYVAAEKQNDQADFSITPAGTRASYIPIQYIEPQLQGNTAAIGFDMNADTERRSAFDMSAKNDKVVITGEIAPLPGSAPIKEDAFQMYFPVYESSCAEKLAIRVNCPLTGYVFAGFQTNDLFKQILASVPSIKDNFVIYDSADLELNKVLFSSNGYDGKTAASATKFTIYSRTWSLAVQVPQAIISAQARTRPGIILTAGIILSLSSSALIYILLFGRVRSLRQAKDSEVQMVKDDLLALAAHQLRTPATAVKQYIIMAIEGYGGELNKDQKKLIQKAYDNNERQLRTVNEMLYVANADAGKLRLIPRSVDLIQLVREAGEEQRSASNEKRHQLMLHLPSTPLYYDADELYLRMAISNLISNAIKYTPEAGKIDVALKITPRNIHIKVTDTGVGISKKQMPDLFKKFSRLDNPLSAHAMGNGLGLYLARRVVELHNGRIKVTSEHTIGSEFTIILPRPKAIAPEAGKKVTKEQE